MATLAYTPLAEIDQIHKELRAGFNSGKTKSLAYRKYQLLQLAYLVQDNADALVDAVTQDLGRPPIETHFLEIGASIGEAMEAYRSVETWAKPEKPPLSLSFAFMRPVTYKEPKGVVLIISPFNYPLWLCMSPLAGAIAAGNAIVLKPSELCPVFASLLTELIAKYLDPSLIRVVNGAIPETTKLLDLPWDHILYTGSGRVGRVVATAAAKHLTPVTLELGGKSPVFLDPSSDLQLAARRILWGKFANAGQTCVAPDYVLVPKASQDIFVEALKTAYAGFFPDSDTPQNITKLVTHQAFKRVNGMLQATQGTVVCGGDTNEAQRFIAPTIVKDVKGDDSLMSDEIFGPILPIVPVEDLDAGIAYVNAHDHPLALYVFSQDEAYKKKVFSSTQSGSAVANETIIIPGATGLPFGGVGPSGSGGYHTGKYGFQMFTHFRASMDTPGWIDKLLGFRFPPYTPKTLQTLKTRMPTPKLPARPKGPPGAATGGASAQKWFLLAFAMAVVAALTRLKTRFAVGAA
ncbi:NAD-dependent aldehyde dehydrogenase [Mycena epipterygia]|nr:NAD-dependent aldehyde dehydrogenase [Mycena epipterygia]